MMVLLLLLVVIAVITRAQTTCELTDLLPLATELNTSCQTMLTADLGGGEIFSADVPEVWYRY